MKVKSNSFSGELQARGEVGRERKGDATASLQGKSVSVESARPEVVGRAAGGAFSRQTHSLESRRVNVTEPTDSLGPADGDGKDAASLHALQPGTSRAGLEASLRCDQGQNAQDLDQQVLEKYFYSDGEIVAQAKAVRQAVFQPADTKLRRLNNQSEQNVAAPALTGTVRDNLLEQTGLTHAQLQAQEVPLLPKLMRAVWDKAETRYRETKNASEESQGLLRQLNLQHVHLTQGSENLRKKIEAAPEDKAAWRAGMQGNRRAERDRLRGMIDQLNKAVTSWESEKEQVDARIGELDKQIGQVSDRSQDLTRATKELEADIPVLRRLASGFETEAEVYSAGKLSKHQRQLGVLVENMGKTQTKLKNARSDIGRHLRRLSFRAAWRSFGDYRHQKTEQAILRAQVQTEVSSVKRLSEKLGDPALPLMVAIDSDGNVSLSQEAARWVNNELPNLGFHEARIAPFYRKLGNGDVRMDIGVIPYPGGKLLLGDEIDQFVRQKTAEKKEA